ncbi:MAG: MarR family transcriptional regulator [Faecalibacterium prausnitzii]
MAMGEPTIAEFSRMMQISTPNAAYKIGSLVQKGYVEKIQSTTDRREYSPAAHPSTSTTTASATPTCSTVVRACDASASQRGLRRSWSRC